MNNLISELLRDVFRVVRSITLQCCILAFMVGSPPIYLSAYLSSVRFRSCDYLVGSCINKF